ncbi:MAG: heparinase II/III family protein, partial [Armatimonadota bacterium]
VQDRFGPQLTSRGRLKQYEPVNTPRELATDGNGQAQVVCSADFSRSPTPDIPGGYALQVGDGEAGVWSITAPEGQQVFSPWRTIELGAGEVQAGERYSLCGDVRLTGLTADQFAAAHFELRFYDSEGTELPHEHFATADPEPGQWETLCVEDVAPEGAVSAGAFVTFMLPAGTMQLRSASIQHVLTTEELMAIEEPLTTEIPHPRLLPQAAAADFKAWVSNTETGVYDASRADIFAEIQKQADEYLQEEKMTFGDTTIPWPPEEMPEGQGGTRWNPMTSGISGRLVELSLTYQGTGDERYGHRAVELLLAISNWPVWYDPVNDRPSLDVGRMSMAAAWAYDLCYDLMSPQEREKAAAAIKRNTLVPLYDALSRGRGNLNSSALWMIGLGSGAVATLGDVEGASMCVRAVEDFVLGQLDVRATSHPIEGQGYDSWAYGNMLVVLNALKRNFGVDHFDHPFLPVIPQFAINFLGNDRKQHAWLEDAGGTTTYVHWHYPLAILGAVNNDPYAGWYLKETETVNSPRQRPFRLLFFDPETPVQAPETDQPGQVFPKAGWASLRSGWEPGGTFIAFVCSDSGTGHAQRHQNHFLTYRDDVLMTTDCGYASGRRGALREYTRGTVGHNSVLVDNTNQMYKLGRIPHFVSNTDADYVMGDATAAYSPSLLQRFHRHLIYVKPDMLFVIDDLKAATEPRTFQWVLHPNSRLRVAESIAVDGEELQVGGDPVEGTVEVQKQGKTMRVRSLYPEDMGFRYLVYEGAEQYNPYLQIDHPPAEEAVMVNLLEFGDTIAENIQTQFSSDTISVTFDSEGDAYTLKLRLVDETGSGPTIEVTKNGEAVLEADEPGIPEDAIG